MKLHLIIVTNQNKKYIFSGEHLVRLYGDLREPLPETPVLSSGFRTKLLQQGFTHDESFHGGKTQMSYFCTPQNIKMAVMVGADSGDMDTDAIKRLVENADF